MTPLVSYVIKHHSGTYLVFHGSERFFHSYSHLQRQCKLALLYYSVYVLFFSLYLGYVCDIQANQAANGVPSNYDLLLELIELIEHFFVHLDIYTRIIHTEVMDEIVIKILMELLLILALATKELKQGRSSESIGGAARPSLAHTLPY
jgi:hypothetical protein